MTDTFNIPLLLLLIIGAANGYSFSCEEVKFQWVNTNKYIYASYACVVTVEKFTNQDVLRGITAQSDSGSYIFDQINESTFPIFCVGSDDPREWRIVADIHEEIDCDQEFTVLFTSDFPHIAQAPSIRDFLSAYTGVKQTIVSPKSGIDIRGINCEGSTSLVSIYSGIGSNATEETFPLTSWTCGEEPEVFTALETVITIEAYNYEFYYSVRTPFEGMSVAGKKPVQVATTGRSGDLQSLNPAENGAYFSWGKTVSVFFTADAYFDSGNPGQLQIYCSSEDGTDMDIITKSGATMKYVENAHAIEIYYLPAQLKPDQINTNNELVTVNVYFSDPPSPVSTPSTTTSASSPTTTTTEPIMTSTKDQDTTTNPHSTLITTASSMSQSGPYCSCAVDRFYFPIDWETTEIWIDVVIILDTSEAMGSNGLIDASTLIDSFIGDEFDDVLTTDQNAKFYTRIGLIAMSNAPEVIYNLNMTKGDQVSGKVHVKEGVVEIDVIDAFQAALMMFGEGLETRPDRKDVRQVMYYVTDSDPKVNMNPLNQFKSSGGIIIVNNFLQEGDVERPGLKNLASDGYYYSDIQYNYLQTIQLFCKANCYCLDDRDAYSGSNPDPAVIAAGGCYHPAPAGVPFSKARQSCVSNRNGYLTSIHDQKKNAYVKQLLDKVVPLGKEYFYWIGYSKIDNGNWRWEDNSTDSYTNWGANEPSTAAVAKCAFSDASDTELEWGAGNCQIGFPYVCEYVPCSVGNREC